MLKAKPNATLRKQDGEYSGKRLTTSRNLKNNHLQKALLFGALLTALSFLAACNKDEDKKAEGNLTLKMRVWNNYETPAVKGSNARFILPFVDVIGYKYEMKVTTDVIQEGTREQEVNWITIYTSDELKGDSERDFQFQLPAGEYKAFSLLQSRGFFWVGDYNGTNIQIPAWNGSTGVFEDRICNVFANELFVLNTSGVYESVNNGEQIGAAFRIEEGKTTSVIIRTNFTSIEWSDNDENGIWSEGDSAGEPIVPEGITTMADFIVTYY